MQRNSVESVLISICCRNYFVLAQFFFSVATQKCIFYSSKAIFYLYTIFENTRFFTIRSFSTCRLASNKAKERPQKQIFYTAVQTPCLKNCIENLQDFYRKYFQFFRIFLVHIYNETKYYCCEFTN